METFILIEIAGMLQTKLLYYSDNLGCDVRGLHILYIGTREFCNQQFDILCELRSNDRDSYYNAIKK